MLRRFKWPSFDVEDIIFTDSARKMSTKEMKANRKFSHVTSFDDVFAESSKKHAVEKKMSFESTSASFIIRNKRVSITDILSSIFKNKDKAKVLDVQQLDEDRRFLLYFECYSDEALNDLSNKLLEHPEISRFELAPETPQLKTSTVSKTMWFPRTLADLDVCGKNVLMYGSELDADHPGFKDESYRIRRRFFTDIALNYKHGDLIPRVDYSPEEIETWGKVYKKLTDLYPTYACKQYLQNLPLLSLYCHYSEDQVPQLEDVSQFLQGKTGFRIRPVAGFLSPRDFLAGLALRVFNCTQYIRHSSDPFYTPEPDVCHELLGHVPLLADSEFAQFSQEIGLASLGASDDDISKLAACYLYTVEFGLCKEDGQLKAYGAGLLSSISELQHALSTPEKVVKFDPIKASTQEFYVTTFQPVYFVSETFEEAKKDMRRFVKNIKRPFSVRFDSMTNSIHVIDSLTTLQSTVKSLSRDVSLISDALQLIMNSSTSA